MIALFDEPIRVSIKAKELGRNGMLLGISVVQTAGRVEFRGVLCVEDGQIVALPLNEMTIDWRYKAETDQWVDLNHQEPDQP